LKTLGPYSSEDLTEDAEHWLCDQLKVESIEDLLAAIGADDTRPHMIAVKLVEYWQQRERKDAKDQEEQKTLTLPIAINVKQTHAQLEVAGVSGLLTRLANCCNPLPDDPIVGFVSRGKGVIVHRSDCYNIARIANEHNERLIKVNWLAVNLQHYYAPIIVTAHERPGLVRDVATVASDVGANLLSLHSRVGRGKVVITATLEIDSPETLHRLFSKLEKTKGIAHVERDLGKKH
jgi:GTP pyrophosphokinase